VANDGVTATDEPTPASSQVRVANVSTDDISIAALREADKQGAEALVLLGQELRTAGKSDLARAAFERGESRGHPEAAMCLGNMLSDLGDTAGARVAYERGVAAGSTMAVLNLGLMLAQQGEVEDALRYLRIAVENGEPEAHWAVGKLLDAKGDSVGATKSFRAGAAAGFAPAAYELGFVLYSSGDRVGAKAAWQRAHELGHEDAMEALAALAREEPAAPQDPGLARELVHQLATACREAMRLHNSCSDSSTMAQKAQYVASQPQAPISRQSFLAAADGYEKEFLANLRNFGNAQAAARELWSQLQFVSGTPDLSMDKILLPLMRQGVIPSDEVTSIMVDGIIIRPNFGSTMDEFLEVDAKVAELMQSAGDP
jgi:tetratricopeptide (TPR) repeat protein